jgi:hypothetical protein
VLRIELAPDAHSAALRQQAPGAELTQYPEGSFFMNGGDFLKLITFVGAGLWLVNKISNSPACGPYCQVLMSDVRGTLVQDLITGVRYWV